MARLASVLGPSVRDLSLPDDIRVTVDIDPVNLM
jgi:hypothetical protein